MKTLLKLLVFIQLLCVNLQAQTTNLDSGLVALYPFNGNANDESSNGNNGIVNGAILTSDRFGIPNSAYDFDGNSNITVSSNQNFDLVDGLSLVTWIKPETVTPNNQMGIAGKGNMQVRNYDLFIIQNSKIRWTVEGLSTPYVEGSTSLQTGQWYLVVGVYEKDQSLKIYIDGVLDAQVSSTGSPLPSTSGFAIGCQGSNSCNSNSVPFDGKIDDIRVYNRALTADEVSILANPFENEFMDLNNNQVPQNWNLVISNGGPGIVNGRLQANVTDGISSLNRIGFVPNGTDAITFEFDGNIAFSTWGLSKSINLETGSGDLFQFSDIVADVNFGSVNKARIQLNGVAIYEEDLPLEFTDYHYTAIVQNDLLSYKAEKVIDNSVLFDTTIALLQGTFDILDINHIEFKTNTTTDNDSWIDNLKVGLNALPTEISSESAFVNKFELFTNYPNPFNPNTIIAFRLYEAQKIDFSIYNLKGQLVRNLFSGFNRKGITHFMWDGKNESGKSVSSGIYFYQLKTANGNSQVRKMTLLK